MIQLFNETENPVWELKKTSEKYCRIQTRTEPRFGIDIYMENIDMDKFDMDVLNTINDFKAPVTLYEGSTSQHFESKRLFPYIKAGSKNFGSTIVLAAFDISDGKRLINHYSRFAYLYDAYYDFDKKQLYMIFSFNNTPNPDRRCYLENVFISADDKTASMKHFYLNRGEVQIVSKQMSMENPIEKGKKGYIVTIDMSVNNGKGYNFRLFVPNKPTRNIFIEHEDLKDRVLELNAERYGHSAENTFVTVINDGFREEAKRLSTEEKIGAVTYFIDKTKDEIVDDQEIKSKILNEYCGKFFKYVMVFCSDGSVFRLR